MTDFPTGRGILQKAEYRTPNDSEFSDQGQETDRVRFHLGQLNWENRPET